MHKCIVCGNRTTYTNVHRRGVRYHGFPKDENMKKVWFNVLGIDHCHEWNRICSDHFVEENYKSGKKRFLLPNAIPQPYDPNGFPSNYATQSNDVETGNNVILPMETNIIREENIENAIVNNFESPRRLSRLTRNNEDMQDHTIRSGLRCSVKNCINRHSDNLSLFRYPKDNILRNIWMDSCGITRDAKISAKRVCSVHFEEHCFTNTASKNRLKRGSVPSLFLDNVPDALSVSINEVPVLSTVEDQFTSSIDNEAAEQLSEEENNDEIDNTNNTSTIIDLTIDDSSNSSLSICTLEPDFTRDVPGFMFKMSKEVVLPNLYWKSEHHIAQNATGFYQRDSDDVTVKKVIFYNNLVPNIQLYGKKYAYNTPIGTIKDLEDLLEMIDSFMKCYGRGGFAFNNCKGYIDNDEDTMCSACQGLVTDEDLQRTKARIEARNKVMESYNNRIAEKKETVLELRKQMAELKINQQQRPAS